VTLGQGPHPRPTGFSTADLPASQRVALWEEHNRNTLISLRCHVISGAPFDGTELNLQLEQMHLARVRGSAHVVERPAEVIRRNPADSIAVYLTVVGEAFFYHHDGVLTLRPGQALICDADQPFMRGFSRGLEELAIKVPRATFRDRTGLDALPAPMVRDFAQGDVTARTFARIVDRALRSDAEEPVDETALLDLLASMAGGGATDPATVHVANARAFIEDHLTDSGLSASRVAAAVGISERHLSRAFAAAGTSLPQFVLARRLERARALLAAGPRTSVGEVSARCGFGSAAYFTRAFRAHFGVGVAEVRRLAAPGRPR
jgi:AraC-like DNA-binding protein